MNPQRLLKPGLAYLLAMVVVGAACAVDIPQEGEKGDTARSKKVAAEPVTKRDATNVEKSAAKAVDNAGGNEASDVSDVPSADEQAIRLTGEAYVTAFAAANAKAIAALFAPDAEYIDELGNAHRGRQAIEEVMSDCLTANPGARMQLAIDSVRFVSPGVAIEDGVTTLFVAGNASEPIDSHYSAVHVKSDGKWLTVSLREQAPKDRRQHRTQLRQLAWLQGDWVDEGADSVVTFSCSSVDSGHFLLRKFTIHIAGQEAMSGTQRIGWDPLTGKLKSWIFDTEGGYSEGSWHRDQGRWVLKSAGVTADGLPASSTTIYTPINENAMTWQSVDHEVAGIELPEGEPVRMVRRAPLPVDSPQVPSTKSE